MRIPLAGVLAWVVVIMACSSEKSEPSSEPIRCLLHSECPNDQGCARGMADSVCTTIACAVLSECCSALTSLSKKRVTEPTANEASACHETVLAGAAKQCSDAVALVQAGGHCIVETENGYSGTCDGVGKSCENGIAAYPEGSCCEGAVCALVGADLVPQCVTCVTSTGSCKDAPCCEGSFCDADAYDACRPLLENGSTCRSDTWCKSSECIDGKCAMRPPPVVTPPEPSGSDTPCDPDWCHGCTGTCCSYCAGTCMSRCSGGDF